MRESRGAITRGSKGGAPDSLEAPRAGRLAVVPSILEPTPENVARCAARLRAGLPAAFPTETVYGLGCDAASEAAVAEVYRLKDRPSSNPLIAHVLDVEMAKRAVLGWDVRAQKVAEAFWPGPIAIILPRRATISAMSVGGRTTVAVRAPAHPVARALLAAFGRPIAAPSANRSGHVSPTTAAHVASEFPEATDLPILDGGPCEVGLESTVLDLSRARPTILRPGAIGPDDLEPLIGPVLAPEITSQGASPGTSAHHYAPRTPSELFGAGELATRLAREPGRAAVVALHATEVPEPHLRFAMPTHADAYAQLLYATLRRADLSGADVILIEAPRNRDGLWEAIQDRLRRACSARPKK